MNKFVDLNTFIFITEIVASGVALLMALKKMYELEDTYGFKSDFQEGIYCCWFFLLGFLGGNLGIVLFLIYFYGQPVPDAIPFGKVCLLGAILLIVIGGVVESKWGIMKKEYKKALQMVSDEYNDQLNSKLEVNFCNAWFEMAKEEIYGTQFVYTYVLNDEEYNVLNILLEEGKFYDCGVIIDQSSILGDYFIDYEMRECPVLLPISNGIGLYCLESGELDIVKENGLLKSDKIDVLEKLIKKVGAKDNRNYEDEDFEKIDGVIVPKIWKNIYLKNQSDFHIDKHGKV